MSKKIVLYYSKYGSTAEYAKYLSEGLGCECFPVEGAKDMDLSDCDVIIFGAGLYAGKIKHEDVFLKNPKARRILFTVGIADPESSDYSDILKRNFSEELLKDLEVFHLRGRLDYKNMTLVHRAMMWCLINFKVKRTKPEDMTEDMKMMIETYGKEVDFTDLKSAEPILKLFNEE
ncbi:MAG: flavodoxin domain-containing protein [Peptoniphilus sp.]|nr:flavodoxin domain-containing protein [Peptoniphilus sp.]